MRKLYYHFTSNKLRDGATYSARGEWLPMTVTIIMCDLAYMQANALRCPAICSRSTLHQVELDGIADTQTTK